MRDTCPRDGNKYCDALKGKCVLSSSAEAKQCRHFIPELCKPDNFKGEGDGTNDLFDPIHGKDRNNGSVTCGCCIQEEWQSDPQSTNASFAGVVVHDGEGLTKQEPIRRINIAGEMSSTGDWNLKRLSLLLNDGDGQLAFTGTQEDTKGGKGTQGKQVSGDNIISVIGYVSSDKYLSLLPMHEESREKGSHHFDKEQLRARVILGGLETPTRLSSLPCLEPTTSHLGYRDLRLEILPTPSQIKRGIEATILPLGPGRIPIRWIPHCPHIPILPPWWLRSKQRVCLQPVRVRQRTCMWRWFGICLHYSYSYSGSGLAFGKSATDRHWAKVNITFDWRPWKTVHDNAGKWASVTTGSEMNDLRSEVTDDDCIEIFFVNEFSPSSTYGGGATWFSGTASAQIISSDEQVSCGVDITHLAHEVGHAIGLKHPGSTGTAPGDIAGSSGTLLCPSGWERDNPRRQSWENGNNAYNPLFVNYHGFYFGPGPECIGNADCGTCAAHIPADSC